jgi:peptidoglycan/xylan/chitin deacetylase (PgdA/CDA1 family)
MKIGVGILSYNRPQGLQNCLASLVANLERDIDVAVSFDRWNAEFRAIAAAYPIWGLTGPVAGIPRANNRLLKFFDGYDAVFLVQDDVQFLRPEWLDLYVRALEAVPYLCFFDVYYPQHPKRPRHFHANYLSRSQIVSREGSRLLRSRKSPQGAFQAIGRRCLETVGYFDVGVGVAGAEHCDYWMRTCNAGLCEPEHFYDIENSAALLKIDWSQAPSLSKSERDSAYRQSQAWREQVWGDSTAARSRVWIEAAGVEFQIVQPGPPRREVALVENNLGGVLHRECWVYANRLPVLAYHAIDEAMDRYATAPCTFARQMRAATEHFRFITAKAAADHFRRHGRMPADTLCLTLDDGYADIMDILPLLDELNIRATVFVIAGWVGRQNDWDRAAFKSRTHLDWSQLKELVACGHEVGSHGYDHVRLTRLTRHEVRRELDLSQRLLEDRLGVPVRSISYPFGGADEATAALATEWYDVGFVAGRRGRLDWHENRHLVRRISVGMDGDDFSLFRRIAAYMTEAPVVAPVWSAVGDRRGDL